MDINKLKSMAEDTTIHKKLVMDNCLIMFKYLADNDQLELGIELLRRGASHDNSKFESGEFESLADILESRDCFTNADATLSEYETKAIERHWRENRHHPEYFASNNNMGLLDIIEMVCDWFARSIQYNTDFIPFVTERQQKRFKFREDKFEQILKYCYLIQRLYNEREVENGTIQ